MGAIHVASKYPHDLLKLYGGQGISLFGSLVSRLALPFLLIYTLSATSMEVAWVRVAEIAPGMLFGLAAGVVVDRVSRRRMMLAVDLMRAVVAASIPMFLIVHRLTLPIVVAAAAFMSVGQTSFDSAFDAYLPTLVPQERLVRANAAFSAVGSVAEVSGFGIAGVLFAWLHAAATFSLDALSFVVSAVGLSLIRSPEPEVVHRGGTPRFRSVWAGGWRLLRQHPLLARLVILDGTNSIFFGLSGAVYMLYISRTLHVPPTVQGLLYAAGGAASLMTARLADRLVTRLGYARALVGGALAASLGTLLLVGAAGPSWLLALFILGQQLFGDGGDTLLDIGLSSLRQSRTDNAILGRIRATWLVFTAFGLLAGTLAGGIVGGTIGYRDTLLIGAGIRLVVAGIAWISQGLLVQPGREEVS